MPTIEESIDVDVPIRTAYDQWTQFETFPSFMQGVDEVTQLDDRRMHWKTSIAGATREFDAEITEQHPDERVAWKATDGTDNGGVVTFHELDPTKTRIMVQIDWEADTITAKAGAAVGADDRQVKLDLKRFKTFIEERGAASGAWRGDVPREG